MEPEIERWGKKKIIKKKAPGSILNLGAAKPLQPRERCQDAAARKSLLRGGDTRDLSPSEEEFWGQGSREHVCVCAWACGEAKQRFGAPTSTHLLAPWGASPRGTAPGEAPESRFPQHGTRAGLHFFFN